jgi:membrane protein implicated in regulation of membrane protease activity
MEGLSASVVLIAIMLGVLLVVVFDVFCLLRLATADTAHFLPKFAWAVLIVCTSPIGGLVYLLAQRLSKRSPEPVTMRPRPPLLGQKAWYGPAREGHGHAPASPEGHAVVLVAVGAAVYLAQAGQVLAAAVVAVTLVIIVFLKSTPPGNAQGWKEFQARRDSDPDRRAISSH